MIDVVSPKENAMNEIKEHMKVVGKDGGHVGTVDGVEGTRIKLTKGSDGQHHYIDKQLVDSVEENTVKLSMDATSVHKQ
jgi:hypothetical protein